MNNLRKTPRANWIDYDYGLFFITICTRNRNHYFGAIHEGKMQLSEIGKLADEELSHPEIHHPHIAIPLYVVMPNHIHAIVDLQQCVGSKSDMAPHVPTEQRNPNQVFRANPDMARHVPTLSGYIASLKAAISRRAHHIQPDFGWQPRYHAHLIRGNRDGDKISEYIINNHRIGLKTVSTDKLKIHS